MGRQKPYLCLVGGGWLGSGREVDERLPGRWIEGHGLVVVCDEPPTIDVLAAERGADPHAHLGPVAQRPADVVKEGAEADVAAGGHL